MATVFRLAVVGLEDVTADDVDSMTPTTPALIELAVLKASDMPMFDPDDDEDDEPEFEDSIFAAHQQGQQDTKEMQESDMVYRLHAEFNCDYGDIYAMTLGEMNDLFDGAKRADDRRESTTSDTETVSSGGESRTHGNRGDLAGQVFGRKQ